MGDLVEINTKTRSHHLIATIAPLWPSFARPLHDAWWCRCEKTVTPRSCIRAV